MMSASYQYLFGPVPSRRLGRSLGIDVTPFETCSFNCLFCQCGSTTDRMTERKEFVPFDAVCAEIARWLAEDGAADGITFAGSGEPTLYSRLGDLMGFIKSKTAIPVILLSNGTLLHRSDVRTEAAQADIVKISLSAWDEPSFQEINRPAPGLSLEQLLEGEKAFRKEFCGELWLEVFLMKGINASTEQVRQIAAAAAGIHPDKIQLNTAVRPPAEAGIQSVAEEELESLCDLFTPRAEIIASFAAAKPGPGRELDTETLVELIRRHPATAAQLAAVAGVRAAEIAAALAPLVATEKLQTEERSGEIYYK
ncbi:MAG: hypothetical protein PWQ29_1729 [Verrucomicrobiota bacterium]|jgi:wyosine [tRNA(Phe)-imidazoG37] synthetase (radical SAM superfamily)|nr:hypothetical protein [Verrucomicrobiota bacterium]MDK2964335.1 hypothetical protein [Verrucomicrobiota bacterium]